MSKSCPVFFVTSLALVLVSGSQDLRAPDERVIRHIHPSIVETLPSDFPDLKHEFARLESQMFDRPKRPGQAPLTRVLPDAHDRIFTPGYRYDPVSIFFMLVASGGLYFFSPN